MIEDTKNIIVFLGIMLLKISFIKLYRPIVNDNSTNDVDESADKVLHFWFDGDLRENYKSKWFPTGSLEVQKQTDHVIRKKFSTIFDKALTKKLESWKAQPRSKVALIVVLDQFSRHLYRNLPNDAPERCEADKVALETTESFIKDDGWDKTLSLPEFIFSLMPLRHSATVERLKYVMTLLDRRESSIEQQTDLLIKFRKQTARRLQHLQDRAKTDESDYNILARPPIQCDESAIEEHVLVREMVSFLSRRAVTGDQTLIVSLSGGVDSMVILKLLTVVRPPEARILCLHIDYANRPESGEEASFLQKWVGSIRAAGHSCDLEIRRIEEVSRGRTDRSLYEKVTREIRYQLYRDALRRTGGGGVMLGHHIDDVRENVVSNVMRGCSAIELSGMGEVGVTEEAVIWRPLLAHPKKTVLDFAHSYGVPYFQDTTPSWSTRGKLRNLLLPLLAEVYGEGCFANLSSLAKDSDEARELMHKFIYSPFVTSIERFSCGLIVDTTDFVLHPPSFWRAVLKDIMHSHHRGMVRDASVNSFCARLRRRKELDIRDDEWVELRKAAAVRLNSKGELMVLRQGVLMGPGEERKFEECWLDSKFPVTGPGSATCGCWTVRWSVIAAEEEAHSSDLQGWCPGQDRLLLGGALRYSLPLADSATPLYLRPVQSLPPSETKHFLKGADRRLKTGLPFLALESPPISQPASPSALCPKGGRLQIELVFSADEHQSRHIPL